MIWDSELVGFLANNLEDLRREHRLLVLTSISAIVATSMLYLLGLGQFIKNLGAATATGQWDDPFWYHFVDALLFFFALGFISCCTFMALQLKPSFRNFLTIRDVLRNATIRGEDQLAPLATIPRQRLPVTITAFRNLRAPRSSWGTFTDAASLVSIMLGFFLLLPGIGLIVSASKLSVPAYLLFISAMTLLFASVILLFNTVRLKSSFSVVAEEQGLRQFQDFFGRPTGVFFPWDQMRSFSTLRYTINQRTFAVFVLDAGESILAWEVRVVSSKPSQQHQVYGLAQLVLAKTNLLLRDLTVSAEQLSKSRCFASYKTYVQSLHESDNIDIHRLPSPQSKVVLYRSFAIVALPLLLIPTLWGVAQVVQRHQYDEYTALLAQVRSHTPLFHDSLTFADNNWSVDPSAHVTIGPGAGGYQIQQNGSQDLWPIAWTAGIYQNVAVEVTVRQSTMQEFPGFGLALHSNNGDDVLVSLMPNGTLFISHYGASGDSNRDTVFWFQGEQYTQMQSNAPNQLDVIVRGAQYACYINGHFAALYDDPTPHPGHVGVFGSGNGSFSDFTIYPI